MRNVKPSEEFALIDRETTYIIACMKVAGFDFRALSDDCKSYPVPVGSRQSVCYRNKNWWIGTQQR